MTLSDLSSIGSLVSGLAVLVSLIYLGQQMRQNTKHTRALIQQGRATVSTDMPLRWAEDASLADIRSRGDDGDISFDRGQISRYSLLKTSMLWNYEDQFHQHRDGLLDDNRFAGTVRNIEINFQKPGMRVVWKQSRNIFGSDFQSFVNGILHQTRAAAPSDTVAAWRTGIEAERSEANEGI
jgi:hypothetical protein